MSQTMTAVRDGSQASFTNVVRPVMERLWSVSGSGVSAMEPVAKEIRAAIRMRGCMREVRGSQRSLCTRYEHD